MYIVNWVQVFWDAVISWQLIVSTGAATPWATTQMNIANSFMSFQNWSTSIQIDEFFASVTGWLRMNSGAILNIQDLQWVGDRPIWVDAGWNIIEITGWSWAGTNFVVEDGLAQTLNVLDNTVLQITGRPGSVVQTVFDTPENLQVRIEWGSPGQVVWYDSDFGAAWVNSMLTYSDVITPIANSPLVITHNWWTTKVQVSVYDTATGELVIPAVVSRDSNVVRITMSTAFEIEIVIIWFN